MPIRIPRRTGAISAALLAAGLILPGSSAQAADAVRGVTDTEITIGTITDLSGVTAVQGVNNSYAQRMAYDEINEKGGINGRKIKYIVEDNQYQVPRAVQAMNKLPNNDSVFILVGNGGTPMNNANMPTQLEKGVANVFPLTAARSMYEPFNKLKFGQFASYYDQMRAGVKYFVEKKGKKNVCAMTQDSDFGRDVLAGAVEQLAAMNMKNFKDFISFPTILLITTLLRLSLNVASARVVLPSACTRNTPAPAESPDSATESAAGTASVASQT